VVYERSAQPGIRKFEFSSRRGKARIIRCPAIRMGGESRERRHDLRQGDVGGCLAGGSFAAVCGRMAR